MLTQLALAALAALGPIPLQFPAEPVLAESAVTPGTLYQGGLFEAQVEDGFVVTETGTGQIHLFEVRRAGNASDLDFPALKLMCAPGAAAGLTAAQFADLLANDVRDYAAGVSMDLAPAQEVSFVIGGEVHSGQRFSLSNSRVTPETGLEVDVLAYRSGENLIGMIAKSAPAEGQDLRAMAELVRASLTVKPVTIASARLVNVGNFTVEVPVVSRTAWNRPEGASFFRIGVGTGNIEFGAQQAPDEAQAKAIGSNYLQARNANLRKTVTELGGTIEDTRWAGEWIQDGQLRGFHTDFIQSDGAAFTISSFYLLAGTNFFTATVTVPTAEHPMALPRLRDMLESLQCPGSEQELRAYFGRTSLNQAHGLTLYYPDTLRLEQEVGDTVRLTLRGEDTLVASDLAMHLFVAPGPPAAEGVEAFARETIMAQFPGAELGQATAIEGALLGQRHLGVQLSWTLDGKSYLATALGAPLHDGNLVALATSRLENGSSASWSFANILAGMQQLDPGDRWIQSPTYDVVFDPTFWTVNSRHVANGTQFRFEHPTLGLEVTFQDADSPLGETAQSSFDALVGAANPYFSIQETWAGTGVTGVRNQAFEVLDQRRDAIRIGGATCIRKRLKFALPDGEPYELFLYYLLTERRAVVAHFWAKAADQDAIEAGQALVETLRLRDGLGVVEQVQILGDLRVVLPLGFVRDTSNKGGPETLYFWNSLVEGSLGAIARIPSAGLPDSQELWAGVEAAVRLGEVSTEFKELTFLGEQREARSYQYTPKDSDEVQLQLKSIAQVGSWTYELTVVGPVAASYELDKLRNVLEAATQVPTWRQVSEQGYNLAYNPTEYSLRREQQPGSSTDTFLFEGRGGSEVFSINDEGAWVTSAGSEPGSLPGISGTLTSQFDLGTTKVFELDAGASGLQFLSSTNTQARPIDGGMSFSNRTPGEGVYISVKFLESAHVPEKLMEESVLNDSAYSIEDFYLIEREVLGSKVIGHMAAFTDGSGLGYANQKLIVPVPGGVLELFATWAPGANDLGLTQVNLFFDTLKLVQ